MAASLRGKEGKGNGAGLAEEVKKEKNDRWRDEGRSTKSEKVNNMRRW